MLIVSLGLHLSLACGIVLAHFHSRPSPGSFPDEAKTELVLVPSQVMTSLPHPASAKSLPSLVPSSSAPVPSASLSQPVIRPENAIAALKPASKSTPMPPIEANPNAHIPQPRLEAVLSPNPPPILNSKDAMVFVLDVSGSMYEPYSGSTRLALARQALAQRIRALRDGTPFAITVYGQTGRNSGPLVAASDATREAAVRFVMEDFDCGGGTNLPAGLALAEELHPGNIILFSDGDLNISPKNLLTSARRILAPGGRGPALAIVGICPRQNTDDESILRSLADQQGGNYFAEQSDAAAELVTSNKAAGSP